MLTLRSLLCTISGALVLVVGGAPGGALAQSFPTRPITLTVGFAAGGLADVVARMLAASLATRLGQPVVVENKPGADSRIALQQLARATPDGYTINISDGSLIVNSVLYADKPYDPVKDFTPILYVGEVPNFVAIAPTIPVDSLAAFIAYAKARPGKLNYASGGGATLLAAEFFRSTANVDMVHVPYKGQALALPALVSGQVHVMVSAVGPLMPLAEAGKLKPLAVTAKQRTPVAPDVPTTAEAGLPEMVYVNWYVILGPAGMPRPVVERLQRDLMAVLAEPQVLDKLRRLGVQPNPASPEAFTAILKDETAKLEGIVKSAKLKVE